MMIKKHSLSLFLFSALAISVALLLGSYFAEQANAQKTTAAAPEGAWEYCATQVTEVYAREETKKTIGTGSICYLKSSGAKCERFETTVEGTLPNSAATARADSLAKMISKLGDEGWQMVGEGPWIVINSEDKPLYFRRPKVG